MHGRHLNGMAETLYVKASILKHENSELKKVIHTRKERASGKRIALKGVRLVSTEAVQTAIEDAQKATHQRKEKTGRKRAKTPVEVSSSEEEAVNDESEAEILEIWDCIAVL
jgi:hypothetical protein